MTDDDSFDASATPINNVWHSPYIGPMWSKVGTLKLKKEENLLKITELKSDADIFRLYLGIWPPFAEEPRVRMMAFLPFPSILLHMEFPLKFPSTMLRMWNMKSTCMKMTIRLKYTRFPPCMYMKDGKRALLSR